MMREPVVIGIGNPWRRDDGAGPAVVNAMARWMPGVETVVLTYPDPAVLFPLWQRVHACIVVDAVVCAYAPAGTIIRWCFHGNECMLKSTRGVSTHGWRIDETLHLAQRMGNIPERLIVFGIVGESFAHGQGLSPGVTRAIPRVVRWIREDIRKLRNSGS